MTHIIVQDNLQKEGVPVSGKDKKTYEIGEQFQHETKYTPETLNGYMLDWKAIPEPFKEYQNPISRISLPEPKTPNGGNLWKLLLKRRTRREYSVQHTLKLNDLAALLWATQGLTAQLGDTFFRTAPSAGGLYPIETYLSIRAVDDLEQGLYHFRPGDFDLEFLKNGDFSEKLMAASLQQTVILNAQVTFIWSGLIARGKWKYRQRCYRYIYLDAGHIGQNLYLAGEALGLSVCAVGAFYDDDVNHIVGLDGIKETVIYMAAVGLRKKEKENNHV
ncbi:MAG: nitroreductase [Syntrophus sp. (in: bacteria)]|nr:nitroreductase [Syntrophus sp. (in: bacteria)]